MVIMQLSYYPRLTRPDSSGAKPGLMDGMMDGRVLNEMRN